MSFSKTKLMEAPPSAASPAASFRVLSYNVNFAIARWDASDPRGPHARVLAALKECADYDIICLQETNGYWEQSVRRNIGEYFPYQRWYDIGAAGGSAILSKTNFTSSLFQPDVKGSWFESMIAQTEIRGRRVQFVNVHLRPPLYDDGSAGIFSYSSTNPVRLAELKGILAHLGNTLNDTSTIILGDFNESESAPGIKHLKQSGFVDAVEQFVPSSQETHRWPLWGISLFTLRSRLDHVLYDKQKLRCQSCQEQNPQISSLAARLQIISHIIASDERAFQKAKDSYPQ